MRPPRAPSRPETARGTGPRSCSGSTGGPATRTRRCLRPPSILVSHAVKAECVGLPLRCFISLDPDPLPFLPPFCSYHIRDSTYSLSPEMQATDSVVSIRSVTRPDAALPRPSLYKKQWFDCLVSPCVQADVYSMAMTLW